MKIIHRVSLTDEPDRREALLSLAIPFIGPDSPLVRLVHFEIDETHPGWPGLRPLLSQWSAGDIVRTEFSSSERNNAKYLKISPAWHHGYPQPENDFGYLKATFDLKQYCLKCGIGKAQVAPFRMKGEPKWGKKHILQLNWVFDEYFVMTSVWEEVFRPLGVGYRAVLDHRTGSELRTVVQLDIKQTVTSELLLDEYPSEICESCGRKKYRPISRGFFPAFEASPSCQMCKTQEIFGSGASAWNAVITGSEVYKSVEGHKLGGVEFVPLHGGSPLGTIVGGQQRG